ncbi:MAG TPA: tetratricopeptide repeat protein, partial [Acidobacteriota bacterium]|nr:tetratricopeptide repeat protein [Acidobacteriota bacterium]
MMPRKAAFITLMALVLAASAWSQYQGKILGTVVDPAKNPVEKAEVSIVSQRSSTVRYDVKTDREGRFIQVGITPGYYLISVKKAGFVPASKEIHVGVAAEESVVIALISAEAAAAKTYSAADRAFLSGNKLYAEQKYPEAAAAYREAIGLDPANWAYQLNLGLSLKKAGQAEEAAAAFRKAVELNPESYSANKEAGETLAKAGDFAGAKAFYEKAAGLSPDDPDAQYNLGVCLVNLSESEAALPRFEKAVELKPDYADAYYQMATILISQNKVPEAKASLE